MIGLTWESNAIDAFISRKASILRMCYGKYGLTIVFFGWLWCIHILLITQSRTQCVLANEQMWRTHCWRILDLLIWEKQLMLCAKNKTSKKRLWLHGQAEDDEHGLKQTYKIVSLDSKSERVTSLALCQSVRRSKPIRKHNHAKSTIPEFSRNLELERLPEPDRRSSSPFHFYIPIYEAVFSWITDCRSHSHWLTWEFIDSTSQVQSERTLLAKYVVSYKSCSAFYTAHKSQIQALQVKLDRCLQKI
jgi:hypothetical protein